MFFTKVMRIHWNRAEQQACFGKTLLFLLFSARTITRRYDLCVIIHALHMKWLRQFSGNYFFFFYLGFLSRTFMIHRIAGEGEAISLTPLYHLHLLHRHLDISPAITAESSPLHIASSWTRTENFCFPSAGR